MTEAEQIADLKERLAKIAELSDVGELFDGHDELNEFTFEENEKHVTKRLDRIHAIASGEVTADEG